MKEMILIEEFKNLRLSVIATPSSLLVGELRVECDLKMQIKEAQIQDLFLQNKQNAPSFAKSEEGIILY